MSPSLRCMHIAALRSELAYCSRLARQPVVPEVQCPQRRELPDLRRNTRQLIAAEGQLRQRRELPDLRRHARQLIVVKLQHPSDVSCPISAGKLVS